MRLTELRSFDSRSAQGATGDVRGRGLQLIQRQTARGLRPDTLTHATSFLGAIRPGLTGTALLALVLAHIHGGDPARAADQRPSLAVETVDRETAMARPPNGCLAQIGSESPVAALRGEVRPDHPEIAADQAYRDAVAAHDILRRLYTLNADRDLSQWSDLLANRTNAQRQLLKETYLAKYGRDLATAQVKEILSIDIDGYFIAMLDADRDESNAVDLAKAETDAQRLVDASGMFPNSDVFTEVLGRSSDVQLRAIECVLLQQSHQATLPDLLSGMGKEVQELFLAQIRRMDGGPSRKRTPPLEPGVTVEARKAATNAAEELDRAFWYTWGTNDEALIGILANQTNAQMKEIRYAYDGMFPGPVQDWIRRETSGGYRDLLLGLVEGQRLEGHVLTSTEAEQTASRLSRALRGAAVEKSVLVEVFSRHTPAQLRQIAEAYGELPDRDLRQDIDRFARFNFRQLLLAVLDGALAETKPSRA